MRKPERLLIALAAASGAMLLGRLMPAWASLAAATLTGLGAAALARRLARRDSPADAIPLASVSHEIRTPLNGILGLTQLLQKMQPTPQQREYLDAIQFSGQALMRLLNDILDYSRIRSGALAFDHESFSLRKWVRETAKSLAPQAHLADLELSYWVDSDVPDALEGDPNRLRQVLSNLLTNAIKYTDEGEILLSVSRIGAHDEGVELKFAVEDTGIGVEEASQSIIFDAFSRGRIEPGDRDDAVRKGGVGLGLAIVKQIVDGMGGRVAFSSEPGRGSTFAFTASFGLAAGSSELLGDGEPSYEGLRALVVEDRPWAREVLRRQLAEWGFEVRCMSGAEPDLEQVASGEDFSLLLLDSRIPGFGTWELAERLQAGRSVPGILMSMTQEYVDGEVLRSHGFLGHLTKPVAPSHLARAISILTRGSAFDDPEEVHTVAMDRLALGGLRVLVAEDHPINRTIATRLLERAGCLVTAVCDGRAALERVVSGRFDIGVFDVQMPEMDGVELAAAVRDRERGTERRLPLVAVTAHASEADRERCRVAGFDGFVSKPFVEHDLLAAMTSAVERRDAVAPAPAQASAGDAASETGIGVPDGDAVFDYETALRRTDGDAELLAELTSLYVEETPATLTEIDASIELGDVSAVERLAHRLKGALLTLAAAPASRAALELEERARDGDLEGCRHAARSLRRELDRLESSLPAVSTS